MSGVGRGCGASGSVWELAWGVLGIRRCQGSAGVSGTLGGWQGCKGHQDVGRGVGGIREVHWGMAEHVGAEGALGSPGV